MGVDAPAGTIDGRPIHRVSDDTIWRDAAALRNSCHDAVRRALAERTIEALVTRSANGIYPAWVKVEAWLPQASGAGAFADPRLRTTLELSFAVRPYREYPVTTSAVARIGRRTVAIADRPNFTADDAVDWVLYTLGAGAKPHAARVSDLLANAFLALIPLARTRYANRILSPFRNLSPITLPRLFVFLGLILIALGFFQVDPDFGPPPIALAELAVGVLALVVALVIAQQRRTVVSVIDRPTIPPRYLLRLDSWHAVIPELGPVVDEVKRRFTRKLEAFAPSGVTTESERYGFRSANGYDERDRLVIAKGQGVAHLHVYDFGADVFVDLPPVLVGVADEHEGLPLPLPGPPPLPPVGPDGGAAGPDCGRPRALIVEKSAVKAAALHLRHGHARRRAGRCELSGWAVAVLCPDHDRPRMAEVFGSLRV